MRQRVLPGLLALSQTVVGVWARDVQRARALIGEYDVGFVTDDYDALLDSVDLVYVAVPVAARVPLAGAAHRAGLPALVEMPLGLPLPLPQPTPPGRRCSVPTLHGFDLTSGPVVAAASYRRTAPAFIRLRELLADRMVHTIEFSVRAGFERASFDPRRWHADPFVAGGGLLAALGGPRLDLLLWLLGEPVEITGEIDRRFPRGAERQATLQLTWPRGTKAAVAVERSESRPHDRLRVTFDGGYLEADPMDSGMLRGRIDDARVRMLHPPDINPHVPLLADFARSAAEGTDPACPIADAMTVDRLIATAYTRAPDPGPASSPAFTPTVSRVRSGIYRLQ
ncbi:putative dehydrogenase [Nonomuraea thailandensis]|uniref:Dehydrogenase n=1 Tax=Nonomuraea thailandensis TaxID=1188745 RepID=A0A9X2K1G7_9ACTN|nr:putative dehydrogenase [Nonomuraea thailandensis]